MVKGEASRLYEDGRHYDGMFGGPDSRTQVLVCRSERSRSST